MTRDPETELDRANAAFQAGRYEVAFDVYRRMATEGEMQAQTVLGWMYQLGRGVPRDLREAEKWYLAAAISGSSAAQFRLATMYRLSSRSSGALDWLQRAAVKAYPPAVFSLGVMYDRGEGVPIDKKKARAYFEEAAQKGHVFAIRNVAGDMIMGRRGVKAIPLGLVLMAKALSKGAVLARDEPQSELILR
jgi:TPR repeat protein